MHTIMVVAGGFVLLTMFLAIGWSIGGATRARAALWFIPTWLVAALVNLWVGVSRAGYSVTEELPIFVLVFAVPAVAAAYYWRRFSRVPQ